MVVVNDPKNLPARILQIHLKKPTETLLKILDFFTIPERHCGTKKNNYYIFDHDAMFMIPKENVTKEFEAVMMLIRKCDRDNFQYLMFINRN